MTNKNVIKYAVGTVLSDSTEVQVCGAQGLFTCSEDEEQSQGLKYKSNFVCVLRCQGCMVLLYSTTSMCVC